jgi:hypothetical protein
VTGDNDAQNIQEQLGSAWLPEIYRERILTLRTRAYHFEEPRPTARISVQHTLLGVELKLGRKRLLCPDLATARYLSVFARLGVKDVAIPYDITKISVLADELESSWYRMRLLIEERAEKEGAKLKSRLSGLLFAKIRTEIAEAGAGSEIPEFKQSTKMR